MQVDPTPLLHGHARFSLLTRLLGAADATPSTWRISPSMADPQQAVRVGSAEDTLWGRLSRHEAWRAPTAPGLVDALMPSLAEFVQPRSAGASLRLERMLLSKGQCVGLFFSHGLHAKVSLVPHILKSEYERQRAAWRAAGPQVPEPLAFGETAEGDFRLHWLLSRRTDARTARPRELATRTGHLHPDLAAVMRRFSTPAPARAPASAPAPDIDNAALLDELQSQGHLQTHEWPMPQRERLQHLLERVPGCPQHGDLWSGNIGWHRHQLMVFDWEDYGRLALPGLDIYLLHHSGVPLSSVAWHGMVEPYMTGQDATLLMPVYEAARLWLRRHYAPAARRPAPEHAQRLGA